MLIVEEGHLGEDEVLVGQAGEKSRVSAISRHSHLCAIEEPTLL